MAREMFVKTKELADQVSELSNHQRRALLVHLLLKESGHIMVQIDDRTYVTILDVTLLPDKTIHIYID